MAFGREISLDIGLNNGQNIRVSNLNLNFEVERSVEPENNYAKINIYNAKKETRDKILVKDNNVSLKAGYKDENNLALIFFGIIQESSTKFEDTNYITELYNIDFGGNQENIKKQIVDFSYNAGNTYSSILSDLSTSMNVSILGQENVASLLLNNGWVFHGTMVQAVKQLQLKLLANDIGLYFDMGEMVIYNKTQTPSQFGIVNISPKSGLIGEIEEIIDEDDEDKKAISFKSLLNPKLKPNTVIRIKSNKFTGGAVIQKIRHVGGNTGEEDFISEGEALVE